MKAAKKEPDLYFFPNQYDNFENPRTHYETTGLELYTVKLTATKLKIPDVQW
ncbi:MAG: hypothetical protein LBB81_04725 [Treponema sp.]|jgi:cysteine synthase|nr:hypothetical protein [Treponema sp.]